MQGVEAVTQAHADALDDGIGQCCPVVSCTQTEQHALGAGIVVRRAFARQVGQEQGGTGVLSLTNRL